MPTTKDYIANGTLRHVFRTTYVGGFDTIVASREQLAQIMVSDCKNKNLDTLPKLVFSSNGQGISLAGKSIEYRSVMEVADIVHADGMSVVGASRLLTENPLPERICTTDFFHDAAKAASDSGLSFYMFGGTEVQNKKAVDQIKILYPKLKICGRRNGYFKQEQEIEICREIQISGADVLWVALGKPLQEKWSARNRENLMGIGWIKTCGGLFGYFAGEEKRAPRWMQDRGFEWVFRLALDPKRFAWRYLVTNPHALWLLLTRSGDRNRANLSKKLSNKS